MFCPQVSVHHIFFFFLTGKIETVAVMRGGLNVNYNIFLPYGSVHCALGCTEIWSN